MPTDWDLLIQTYGIWTRYYDRVFAKMTTVTTTPELAKDDEEMNAVSAGVVRERVNALWQKKRKDIMPLIYNIIDEESAKGEFDFYISLNSLDARHYRKCITIELRKHGFYVEEESEYGLYVSAA